MQNPNELSNKPKKSKKKGNIQRVWEMSQKGSSVKDIAKKTGLKEQIVRSYIWRKKNPDKHAQLLQRYLTKRKAKLADKEIQETLKKAQAEKSENSQEKA